MANTALDNELIPTTLAIIEEFGKTVNFIIPSDSLYIRETGEAFNAGPRTFPHKVSPPDSFEAARIDGILIQATDARVYLPSGGLEFLPIKDRQQVKMDSQLFTIRNVKPIYSGEQIACYELALRA